MKCLIKPLGCSKTYIGNQIRVKQIPNGFSNGLTLRQDKYSYIRSNSIAYYEKALLFTVFF